MAPSKKAQRFAPGPTKEARPSKPLFDPEPSDTEAGALQPSNSAAEPDWEGFGGDDGEEIEQEESSEEESSDEESSSEESVEIATKKKEKPVLPKDAEEEELERLIFGDSAGFKEGIDSFSLKPGAALGEESEEDQGDGEDFGNVADQDLFFFDTGPTAQPAGALALTTTEDSDDDDKPAWDDSDDERLVVSLASVPQLRKLRDTEDDDMVNGKEYVRRLRRQYERLYPAPEWALHASGKTKRKRHLEDDESDAESASDMDVDDADLSTLPLARLLQNADILSRTSKNSTKRRKLQAGTVEIARLKDVAGAGPVSSPRLLYTVSADLTVTGCDNFPIVPSHVPAYSVVWPQLDALTPPCESIRPP